MKPATFVSSYIPLDIAASTIEFNEGVQEGESCRIDALKNRFAWMRGHVNGWYGWANDGKGVFLDFLNVIKCKEREDVVNGKKKKVDGWKFALFKPEDMSSTRIDGKGRIDANRIYKNLAWTLTGKTWNKNYAKKTYTPQMTLEEEMNALDYITQKFFVIHPKDRRFKNLRDEFMFLYEKYGVDVFQIDPWNSVLLPDGDRGDERLVKPLMECKEMVLETNTIMNIVNHPKSMTEVHVTKDPKSPFKVVNQFHVLGGSAWDMKMDGQFSVYRCERHLDPADKKVHLWNLKQKESEIVGVERGVTEGIEFSPTKRQYYFDGVNPIDGSTKQKPGEKTGPLDFTKVDSIQEPDQNDPNWNPF